MLRVGKLLKSNSYNSYNTDGFTDVKIHVKDPLSPYVLKDDGKILENVWQFSKLYPVTHNVCETIGWNTVIWKRDSEIHWDEKNREPTEAYWKWRNDGFKNAYAVRYPNSYYGRGHVKCSIVKHANGDIEYLDYIQARKKIYCKLYKDLTKTDPFFISLKRTIEKGEKLQINEVDGPSFKHIWPYNLVKNHSLPFDREICKFLLNDTTHPFGHGYTIAMLLAGYDDLIET